VKGGTSAAHVTITGYLHGDGAVFGSRPTAVEVHLMHNPDGRSSVLVTESGTTLGYEVPVDLLKAAVLRLPLRELLRVAGEVRA